jgi:polyisoprenyl-phosphate glycosyltransferase
MAGLPQPIMKNRPSEAVGEKNQLSVVLPVFKNAQVLPELHARLHYSLDTHNLDYELLFVNDACPQGSLAVLRQLAGSDPRVAVLSLAHNAGQQRAIMLGLEFSRGESVVVMDADLQDPPEAIPSLLELLDHQHPVVFAGRRGHYEEGGRLVTSRFYKLLLHWLTGIKVDAGLFLAMEREVALAVLSIQDADPYLVAMIGCTGCPTFSIPVERSRREYGQSTYTSWGRIKSGLGALRWVLTYKMGLKRAANNYPGPEIQVGEFIGQRFSNR